MEMFPKLIYVEICELCENYSRGNLKTQKIPRDSTSNFTNFSTGGVTWDKFCNLFVIFSILISLSS